MASALKRLTDREKDCLRRVLLHQTAKEMAIDMGLSPHAIEKRLKIARAKLGVSSSLQAARVLAASEGYQETGPQRSDLDEGFPSANDPLRSLAIGASLMTIAAVAATILLSSTITASDPLAIPKPDEIIFSGPSTFEDLDKNKNGQLEGDEAPTLARIGGDPKYERLPDGSIGWSGDYVTVADAKSVRDRFYSEADVNGDGVVSQAEFKIWSTPESGNGQPASAKDEG